MEIFSPTQWVDVDAINFMQKLLHNKDEPELIINTSTLKFVYPFATLLIAMGIRDLVSYRTDCGLVTHARGHSGNDSAQTYLKHFGFFQFIGLDEGKHPNEAPGGARYLPILKLSEQRFREDNLRLQEGIERECQRLARIIYSDRRDEGRALMLGYCLRETVRNVFEHADVSECYLMAQRWKNGFAEIAIADEGIGILGSLRDSHNVVTPNDAVQLALKPGISSNLEPENNDKWQNSGFGLFILSELGLALGEFAIASNNHILFISKHSQLQHSVPIHGTAVKLRVNTTESDYFPNVLKSIVKRGEELAKTIPGARVVASKKSKMIDLTW